jgi:hypothetical protein
LPLDGDQPDIRKRSHSVDRARELADSLKRRGCRIDRAAIFAFQPPNAHEWSAYCAENGVPQ